MDTPLDSWLLNQIMKWIHQIEIIIFFMSPQTIDRRDLCKFVSKAYMGLTHRSLVWTQETYG